MIKDTRVGLKSLDHNEVHEEDARDVEGQDVNKPKEDVLLQGHLATGNRLDDGEVSHR